MPQRLRTAKRKRHASPTRLDRAIASPIARSAQVDGEYGSASYHGLDGLRKEFRRETGASEDVHERIDAGFTLLKWLNRGNMFATRILDNLEVRDVFRGILDH